MLWLGTISAIGAAAAALGGPLVAASDDTAPAQGQSCTAIVDRVLDLRAQHPDAARLYAQPGRSTLPALADSAEVDRCGDPEKLLESVANRPG